MKLGGLTVLDLSQFLPGPHLTMMMADHGAEVIKIEPPGAGEPTRHVPYRSGGESVWFRNTHRGKKSVVLDLKSPQGRDDFLALAAAADVIVEGFRPGVAARLGIDYRAVAARNPGIVYASISAFGQAGDRALRPAHDAAVEALAGALSVNLDADGRPMLPHLPVADMNSSMLALAGILMALYRREKTGRGDYIDISMQDATMAWMAHCIGSVFAEDRPPAVKAERQWGGHAFNNVYATKGGGHIVLSGMEEKFVRNLLRVLRREDLAEAALQPPGAAHAPVKAFLAGAFLQRTRDEWEAALLHEDVCFAPVLDLREAFAQPHVSEREMILRDADGNLHIGNPIKMREEPARLDFKVPALGEHTAEVLARRRERAGKGSGQG